MFIVLNKIKNKYLSENDFYRIYNKSIILLNNLMKYVIYNVLTRKQEHKFNKSFLWYILE